MVKMFKIKPERIYVNYLGIEIPKNQTTDKRLSTIDYPYLLYVGQAFPRRRAKETLQAFTLLASKYPNLKLILVGQDKYNPPILENLVKETNQKLGTEKIIYHSYIENDEALHELMNKAKLFIYISSSEAFGLPPLEALALGVPPVVKEDALNRELYGENAFFVANEKDPAAIAKVLENALNDTARQQEIIQNSEKVVSKFNWTSHTEKFLETIKEVIHMQG